MKQVLQRLDDGRTYLLDVPVPAAPVFRKRSIGRMWLVTRSTLHWELSRYGQRQHD